MAFLNEKKEKKKEKLLYFPDNNQQHTSTTTTIPKTNKEVRLLHQRLQPTTNIDNDNIEYIFYLTFFFLKEKYLMEFSFYKAYRTGQQI